MNNYDERSSRFGNNSDGDTPMGPTLREDVYAQPGRAWRTYNAADTTFVGETRDPKAPPLNPPLPTADSVYAWPALPRFAEYLRSPRQLLHEVAVVRQCGDDCLDLTKEEALAGRQQDQETQFLRVLQAAHSGRVHISPQLFVFIESYLAAYQQLMGTLVVVDCRGTVTREINFAKRDDRLRDNSVRDGVRRLCQALENAQGSLL